MKRRSILASVCVASVMVIGTLWPSARIPGIVANVHARHHGCSNASLQGPYGYVRTGINQVLGGPIAIVGLTTFNGDGTLSGERETASRNGEIQDWTDLPPTGTYTVDLDCTGSIFAQDGTKGGNIVVVDGGNEIFLISTQTGRIITAVGKKVDVKDRDYNASWPQLLGNVHRPETRADQFKGRTNL